MIKLRNMSFKQKMLNPFFFNLFLLLKLPIAFFSGLKMKELSDDHAIVFMKYNYLNKNPFGSIYFACLSMAGELASGMLAASIIYNSNYKLSMLVTKVTINFKKKAVGSIFFECNQGEEIAKAIHESIQTAEGQTIESLTTARNKQGDIVAEFFIKWSFKLKN